MASLAPKVKKAKVRTGDWRVIVMDSVSYKTLEVVADGVSEQEANAVIAAKRKLNDGKCYALSVGLRGIL